jgi:hypothetical protein
MAKYSFQDIRVKRKKVVKKNEGSGYVEPENNIDVGKKNNTNIDSSAYSKLRGLPKNNKGDGTYRVVIWGVAFFIVVGLVLSIFGLFSGATIKVVPKSQGSVIDSVFKAVKETSKKDDNISFRVMAITTEKEKKVPSTNEKKVDRKSSGTIIVYNAYSSSKQRLIKNTRFETPKGNVYRIKNSITVPGTIVKNGEIIPGSVEAIVYADEPGESYNIGLTDFTIPGFKKDPRYEKFYARSKTEMKGGFSGVVKVPSDEDLEKAKNEIKAELNDELTKEAKSQKPDGFVLYDDAKFITFDDQFKEDYSDSSVKLILGAKLYGVIFDKEELSRFIAEKSLAVYDGTDVFIPELENLSFKIQNKESISPFDEDLKFKLSGNLSIIWSVDKDKLKKELTGTPKKKFQDSMSKFPKILSADASIRPFWKRSFPNKESKIKIEVINK